MEENTNKSKEKNINLQAENKEALSLRANIFTKSGENNRVLDARNNFQESGENEKIIQLRDDIKKTEKK